MGPRYQTQVVRLGSKCLTHWGILLTLVLVLSKYISFSYALCSFSISHFSAKQKSDQCIHSDGSFWGGTLWGPLVSCGLSHSSSSGLRICSLPTPESLTLSLFYQSHWKYWAVGISAPTVVPLWPLLSSRRGPCHCSWLRLPSILNLLTASVLSLYDYVPHFGVGNTPLSLSVCLLSREALSSSLYLHFFVKI